MFGFNRRGQPIQIQAPEIAVEKLFFDAFSKRVLSVEDSVKNILQQLADLKVSREKSEVSDLVLLERLQRTEAMLAESLEWIQKVAVAVGSNRAVPLDMIPKPSSGEMERAVQLPPALAAVERSIILPGGESGSLSSITTPTELQVLALLSEQGPKSAPDIGRVVGRSREHSARLMKKLFEEGYVKRDQTRIPFRYSLVDRVRASFQKPEERKEQPREEAAAVQA